MENTSTIKQGFYIPAVFVLFIIYFALSMATLDSRAKQYYKLVEETVISDFRLKSSLHAQFIELYTLCNGYVTEKPDKVCMSIATSALEANSKLNAVVEDYFRLEIVSFYDQISLFVRII